MYVDELIHDAVLRVGEVVRVHGRIVTVEVDKNKNQSDLLYEGEVIKNISVNSFVEIRKGFLSLIGKVEGEEIKEDFKKLPQNESEDTDRNSRLLTIALIGYIDSGNEFTGGISELPLIGNEAFVVSSKKLEIIHRLVLGKELSISAAEIEDGVELPLPVDGLFNSHIAIFGNTGSGKSNTLAHLYQEFLVALRNRNQEAFTTRTRFLLFDFNGEYFRDDLQCVITEDKTVYRPSEGGPAEDKIPLGETRLLDIEVLRILTDASEKTQQPFLGRVIDLHNQFKSESRRLSKDLNCIVQDKLKEQIEQILIQSNKTRAYELLESIERILPRYDLYGARISYRAKLDWYNKSSQFVYKDNGNERYFQTDPWAVFETELYKQAHSFSYPANLLDQLAVAMSIRLIDDILESRVQVEFVAPVIGRFLSRKRDLSITFRFDEDDPSIWKKTNFLVVNLQGVGLVMRKTVPLLLCKMAYAQQKTCQNGTLNIIVDEAHQILSEQSFRETENWKDYRLETFEEIIKEGRKYGVFLTISSQRPQDISQTITSQAHNFFIHRLQNEQDLRAISRAVSYIDKLTYDSIPTLSTGTCIFSGTASRRPITVNIRELPRERQPRSQTTSFAQLMEKNGIAQ